MVMTDNSPSWERHGSSYKGVLAGAVSIPAGVYTTSEMSSGDVLFTLTKQNYDQVYNLPGLPIDFINAQIDKFWDSEALYEKYKFTHKRGVLLYGPPGNGKTCVIASLIEGLVKKDGVVLCVGEFSLAARALGVIKRVEPKRKVMTLIEDFDTLLSGDYRSEEPHALSMLDGQTQVNGVVHVATTNYPEALADRFIRRPGRFDLVIGMGMPVKQTRKAYFQKILNDENHPELEYLVDKTEGLSLSYLREIASTYLCLGIPIEETISRVKKNFSNPVGKMSDGGQLGFKLGYEDADDGGNHSTQGRRDGGLPGNPTSANSVRVENPPGLTGSRG
jgi:ATPase family associated with various cellular activities (AAA)